MLLGFVSVWFGLPGVITAVFAITLGAAGGSLIRWRHDRGLWMLAGLFLLLFVGIYGLTLYGRGRDIVRGAAQPEIGLAIDFSLGTLLLSSTVRFLWRVAKYNWTLSPASGWKLGMRDAGWKL